MMEIKIFIKLSVDLCNMEMDTNTDTDTLDEICSLARFE